MLDQATEEERLYALSLIERHNAMLEANKRRARIRKAAQLRAPDTPADAAAAAAAAAGVMSTPQSTPRRAVDPGRSSLATPAAITSATVAAVTEAETDTPHAGLLSPDPVTDAAASTEQQRTPQIRPPPVDLPDGMSIVQYLDSIKAAKMSPYVEEGFALRKRPVRSDGDNDTASDGGAGKRLKQPLAPIPQPSAVQSLTAPPQPQPIDLVPSRTARALQALAAQASQAFEESQAAAAAATTSTGQMRMGR